MASSESAVSRAGCTQATGTPRLVDGAHDGALQLCRALDASHEDAGATGVNATGGLILNRTSSRIVCVCIVMQKYVATQLQLVHTNPIPFPHSTKTTAQPCAP